MEERILEAIEYILMAINDIKDYKDFINYKSEIIKAINDIKNSVKNPFNKDKYNNINDSEENDKKSKISSILGLQFDYDSLLNENDIKFFSDYEEKNNNIKNKINSYIIKNKNKCIYDFNKIKNFSQVNKLTKKQSNNYNYLYNPEKTLSCTESLRNKKKLLNKYHSYNNSNNKNAQKSNKLFNNRFLLNKEKEKIDIISEIILKMNRDNYLFNSLIKKFGNKMTDQLLSNNVSDDFVEAVQNEVLNIEKRNNKHKNDKIREKIDKLYKQNMKIINNEKKVSKINSKESYDLKNMYKQRRYKSFNKHIYSEPYQEFNFKNNLRETYKNFNLRTNPNGNEGEIKNDSKKEKIKNNKKGSENPFKTTYHQKPFISATCGYGKYFDEPLQKGGISKLDF